MAAVTHAVEIWRGGVDTWECDEMGHMNVRFYVARFMEGLAGLALHLGLPEAFSPEAAATLVVQEHHLRFLREARPGAPLHMTGGVVEFAETGALLLQVLIHSVSGEPCASALTRVAHSVPHGAAFAWPKRTHLAADALRVETPAFAAPRGLGVRPVSTGVDRAQADALDLACIGRGVIGATDVDAFGRMRPELFIGRISDGVPGLLSPLREAMAAEGGRRVGGAALEYRLIHLAWPAIGAHVELRSGVGAFGDKTQTLVHWLLDPISGRPWGVAQSLHASLDLDARTILPTSAAARAALAPLVKPGLSL